MSPKPGTCAWCWGSPRCWASSASIAAFGLFYLGDRVFHLDHPHLQTLMYLKLSVAGHLTIFLTRTRGPFWSIRPARILWMAVLGTQTVATLIAVYGLFMTPLGWGWAVFVWGYALAWFLVTRPREDCSRIGFSIPSKPRPSSKPKLGQYLDSQRSKPSESTMKIVSKDFCVREGHEVDLKKWPTKVDPVYKSKEQYKSLLEEHVAQLSSQQQLLYASNRHAVLLIFQAMDAAGKDGAIQHVMSGVNPQGCQVFSFKHPSATELEHDFLWRTTRDLPERGRIGIFNRSYYEEVLIVRVHPEILRSEAIPETPHHDKKLWHDRYRSIVDLEKHLHGNGTRIIKFFLHLSKEEQRKRFLARIDEPDKNWKFSLADIQERKFWKQYMKAYEECLSATSTEHAPWYVVPADDKENARLIVSRIVLDTLEGLKMAYPKTTAKRRRELLSIRKELAK